MALVRKKHLLPNGAGHRLALTQTFDPERLVPGSRPVLVVPGYGMNSFIFSFHPRGTSLEGALVEAGLEVFRVDLRCQGESERDHGDDHFGLAELAIEDLGTAVDGVLEHGCQSSKSVAMLGCSLGGTLMFTHVACVPDHRVGAMISVGSPLRWVKIHPLLRAAFGSERLAGLVRIKGARRLAGALLPHVLARSPWLLSLYMSPEHIDTDQLHQLLRTVEDPNQYVNREIARWIKRRDLVVRGVDVAAELTRSRLPLLTIAANADGIVPPATAAFPHHQSGSKDRTLLAVGGEDLRLAHADMFISNHAAERVFAPLAAWLLARPEELVSRPPVTL